MQSQENTDLGERAAAARMAQRIMAELSLKTIWMPCGDSPAGPGAQRRRAQVAATRSRCRPSYRGGGPRLAQVPDALSGPLLLVAATARFCPAGPIRWQSGAIIVISAGKTGRTQPAALYRQADVLPAPLRRWPRL